MADKSRRVKLARSGGDAPPPIRNLKRIFSTALVASLATVLAILVLTSCGDRGASAAGGLSGSIEIDGSSTVYPITEAVAEEFAGDRARVRSRWRAQPAAVSGSLPEKRRSARRGRSMTEREARRPPASAIWSCRSRMTGSRSLRIRPTTLSSALSREAGSGSPGASCGAGRTFGRVGRPRRSACTVRAPTPAPSTTSRARWSGRKGRAGPITRRARTTTCSSRA